MNHEIIKETIEMVNGTKYIYKDGIKAIEMRMERNYPKVSKDEISQAVNYGLEIYFGLEKTS